MTTSQTTMYINTSKFLRIQLSKMNPSLVLAAILLVGVQGFTEDQQKRLEQISADCVRDSQIDPEVLKAAEHGKVLDDPKLRLHAFCFAKAIGLQDEKGDVLGQKVKERLSQQIKDSGQVDQLASLCFVKKGTPEDTAWDGLLCLKKNTPNGVAFF